YHGRDVDSIIRDLTERAVGMEHDEAGAKVRERAERAAEDRVIDQLLPASDSDDSSDLDAAERRQRTREKLRAQLRAGGLAERAIEVSVEERSVPAFVMSNMGLDQMGPEFEKLMERAMPSRTRRQRLSVPQALKFITEQEIDRMIDREELHAAAIKRTEQ